ncbi:hypothetical protein DmAi_19470 [Acetobacter persici]|uniref:Uncharacterized protein n=1 Tax=Acetobacter persici TaxID=1076596 RepID=A0A6V8I8C6_9PROT|nr:hypothetical protein DmAi_19470 [Acetobacter persici]
MFEQSLPGSFEAWCRGVRQDCYSFGPLLDDTVLLPDPRFVLKPDFDPFAARQMADVGLQDCREVFLNASMTDGSCPGWWGRVLT